LITLYVAGPLFPGLPDPSPFVSKAEILLKLSGLPYQTRRANFAKAPKGKIPYIQDGDGPFLGDTTLIRWHLEQSHGVDFDPGLSPADKAAAWAFEKMCEEHLYWAMVQPRWMVRENFDKGPRAFFQGIPVPMRQLVVAMAGRKVKRDMAGHGIGKHTPAEIERLGIRDVDALAAFLGEKPWLMGEAPCGADASVWSMLAHVLYPRFDTGLRTAAERHANLVAYRDRGLAHWFPNLSAGSS
jgi:glutathione S-transferase